MNGRPLSLPPGSSSSATGAAAGLSATGTAAWNTIADSGGTVRVSSREPLVSRVRLPAGYTCT